MSQRRELPDWKQIYQEKEAETMAWFNPDIDADLDKALTKLNLKEGKALDLGTGPATQAIALAKLGFTVTGTDISDAAISRAKGIAQELGLDIDFRQDDILNSKLEETFDIVFDRGCFHVFHEEQRQDYVRNVSNLVQPKGYLLLKCFSHLETRPDGPYRFTPQEIGEIFAGEFQLSSVEDTVYQGTMEVFPKALFCVLEKI
ncbi:MAG TPA: class I SAM-dependent methyltransferase [Cyanobacteria bacterium UBA11149]|nr:class I SAM-dependent methyltransferase [Cyanobacteria bacterium UBA11367]HBE59176.1 class I SAM-dependent methyltransferase [Cyanobacteria bacterium UBA11366]HBK64162.1 class I SAM-dependent methyltransferase [Cyanobacteria bacterium UBA11166]HBR72539.1 class I SAM-dependent methyltransferase [Cyanobacteria bacterium UBA11159]HBS69474.1 class I SAM-dependent methyltransferase [Cyanobacteria bacterium UBA11153]HBW89226.1 class I SAM-dependent methyltransferase [Cyanobacteria bacterium UBA11